MFQLQQTQQTTPRRPSTSGNIETDIPPDLRHPLLDRLDQASKGSVPVFAFPLETSVHTSVDSDRRNNVIRGLVESKSVAQLFQRFVILNSDPIYRSNVPPNEKEEYIQRTREYYERMRMFGARSLNFRPLEGDGVIERFIGDQDWLLSPRVIPRFDISQSLSSETERLLAACKNRLCINVNLFADPDKQELENQTIRERLPQFNKANRWVPPIIVIREMDNAICQTDTTRDRRMQSRTKLSETLLQIEPDGTYLHEPLLVAPAGHNSRAMKVQFQAISETFVRSNPQRSVGRPKFIVGQVLGLDKILPLDNQNTLIGNPHQSPLVAYMRDLARKI